MDQGQFEQFEVREHYQLQNKNFQLKITQIFLKKFQ